MPPKGKEVAGKGSKGKRKLDDDKSGSGRKRANPGVLRFFEDAAEEYDESSDSDFSDLFGDDEFDNLPKVENEPGNTHSLPVFPKQEEMAEEDFDKMMEERYSNARFTYAGDDYETKRSVERNSLMMFDKEPTIWKVKCTVNRERHSVFCLMQKYVDLKSLGTKLQIISAFAVDHSKGHIYVEADRLCDVVEACKGLCSVYSTRVWAVPKNDVSHLLSVRPKYNGVSEGTWARVKNGKYKGDLAQVVAVNDERKRATVKLIPRIDLQALAQKFGSGVPIKRTATSAPRLISPSELEEFRPLIQYRRDRETGIMFENLDTLMLKDGYLYKKVSIDSLSCSGVMPTEDELLKFRPSENEQSSDMEWLSQLYGDKKKKRPIKFEKGGGKGESSSGLDLGGSFELHDLVCFGRKDFGLVIGREKDDSYKILKEGSEGPIVVTISQNDLKNGLFDAKFTALDKNTKSISINDAVRVLDGPLQGRQGTVKQIYRGTIFLYDENETENGGYFCSKSQICEKIKLSADPFSDKAGEEGTSGSPKSPLLPKEDPWQARDNKRDFNQGDKDGFSVGQTLRIRVGPLKGYLCRVLAVRRSDITVKLDSQQKVLTVKSEHLCEVRGKSSNISMSEDGGASSLKPFDLLGTQGGSSSGWMNAAGTSAEGDGWNSGGPSAERSSWSNLSAPGSAVQPGSNPSDYPKTDVEDTAWGSKVTPSEDVPWGTTAAKDAAVANSSQAGGWGKNSDSWNKASSDGGNGSSASGWGKSSDPTKDAEDNWSKAKLKSVSSAGASDDAWGKNDQTGNQSSSWGQATTGKNQEEPWGKGKEPEAGFSGDNNKGSGWGTKNSSGATNDEGSWGKLAESHGKGQDDSWGKAADKGGSKDGLSASKSDWNSSAPRPEDQTGDCSKLETGNKDEASNWKKAEVVSGSQNSGWGNKSTLISGPSEAAGEGNDSGWGQKSTVNSGPSEAAGDQDSGWGKKKSTWNSGSNEAGGNQDSGWGKKGIVNSGPSEAAGGGNDSGWGQKSTVNSGPSEAAGVQDSGWGKKKSTWNSGPNEAGGNLDSGWGKKGVVNSGPSENKSTWNSGPSAVGGNEDSGWGKKSTWNSGSGESGGNQESGWAKKSTWSSGSGGNQDSDWGKKSSWNSGNPSENDNQNDSYGGRESGGNWRGRGGSDRGGYRGRGRGGSDSGGFGGGGRSDRGGFRGRGGRGGDRGGYGGRGGGDGGGFGGRGGGDGGGFGGGDRGGFGGRGRGRRDQTGGWSSRNDSGDYKPSSWSSGGNNNGEGWNSNGGGRGGGSWSQGGGGNNNNGGGSLSQGGGGRGGGSWSQGGGGNNNNGGGSWSQGGGGNNNGDGWKSSGGGGGGGSWSQGGGSQSWNSGSGGASKQGGGWNSQGDNDNAAAGGSGGGWGKGPASGDQKKSWNEPDGGKAGEASGSGWNEGSSGGGGGGGGGGGDPWGKKAGGGSSSWGKDDDGGSKGGW